MHHVSIEEIAARPHRVWQVLTDVERWPEWTASMVRVTRLEPGPLTVGSTTRVEQPTGKPMVWTVTDLVEGRCFTWVASAPGMRFVAGHELTGGGDGVHAELSFSLQGPLSWVGALLAGARIRRYVGMEIAGLKRRSELPAEA
jgi:uncharacterized protein YndB with AHSA1/START domain